MTRKALDEVAEQVKKIDQLIKDFQKVANIVATDEMTLLDIVANEERARNIADDLTDAIKKIIDIRQYDALEEERKHLI